MFQCPPPSPNPHFKTGNYFYPLRLCPGALPFHPGNMDQAFNPFFPAYYLLALGPFPLPPLLRPAQTRQNRKCCHEEQEGCPHLWPLLRCQHKTPEPLSLACPGSVDVQRSLEDAPSMFSGAHWPALSQRARGAPPRGGSTEKLKFCLVLGVKPTPVKNPYTPEWASVKRALWVGRELSGVPDVFCMWVVELLYVEKFTDLCSWGVNLHSVSMSVNNHICINVCVCQGAMLWTLRGSDSFWFYPAHLE